MKKVKLMLGDNIESLKKLPDNSIDSIVSDPPIYHIFIYNMDIIRIVRDLKDIESFLKNDE